MAEFKINKKTYECPVELTVQVIGGKWKALLLWQIRDKVLRYGEFKRSVPDITHKMLSQCLKELENDGLVKRKVYQVIPPMVEYSLTPEGKRLMPVLEAMQKWGVNYKVKKSA